MIKSLTHTHRRQGRDPCLLFSNKNIAMNKEKPPQHAAMSSLYS